jgi:surface polysaccharide O-acyltransferase-like enzyme
VTEASRAEVPAPAGGPRPRLAWIDATRGYSVAAVVLFHVVLWTYAYRTDVAEPADSWWSEVNGVLGSLRMPVLLAVSGLVLSRQVRAGLQRSTTLYRAVNNYYLYVVWLAVYAAFYALVPEPSLRHRVDGAEVLVQLVLPNTTLWYLFALALYVPLLAALRRVPAWAMLTALGALCVGVHVVRASDSAIADALYLKIPELFFFFAIGVYGADALRALARRASWPVLGAAMVVAAVVTLGGRWMTSPVADAVLFTVRGVAFLVAGMLAIVLACRWRPIERLGSALGERTILVYVLHPLLLAAFTLVEPSLEPVLHRVMTNPVGAMLYPLVMTALVVAVCLGAHTVVRWWGWTALLGLPPRAARAMGRDVPNRVPTPVTPVGGSAA